MQLRSFLGTIFLILLIPALAWGQEIQSETYKPRPAQEHAILDVSGSGVLGHMEPSLALDLHFADDSVQTVDPDTGNIQARAVSSRLKGSYRLSLGLLDKLQVGAALPLVLYQKGEASSQLGTSSYSSAALSDLWLSAKLQVLEHEENDGLGLALRGDVSAPTGTKDSFNSSGKVRGGPTAVMDFKRGHTRVAANVGYDARASTTTLNYAQRNALQYGLAGEVPLGDEVSVVSSLTGSLSLKASDFSNAPAEALGGVRFYLSDDVILQAGGGAGITGGVGTPDWRGLVSVDFHPTKQEKSRKPAPRPTAKPKPKPKPEKKAEPKENEPTVKKRKIVLKHRVHFDTDKAALKPTGKAKLKEVADILKKYPQLTEIRVGGHTDSRASDEYNRRLSIRRAIAVETFLMKQGIDKHRLKLVGYGESRPIAPNDHPQKGMAENRRAEFRILEVEGKKQEPVKSIILEISQ